VLEEKDTSICRLFVTQKRRKNEKKKKKNYARMLSIKHGPI
jgi:hypothetical protein